MKKINTKLLLIVLSLVVAASGAYFYFRLGTNLSNSASSVEQSDGINFRPPTEEEKQRADQNKDRIQQREDAINNAQPQDGSIQKVIPAISYIGQYGSQIEVGSYVQGIYEDGGTCTARFSKDRETFTRSVQASKNVSSVDCPLVAVPISEFPSKGTWNVVVSYSSAKASGESESKTVDVK